MKRICSLTLLFFIMLSFCMGVRAESPYWAIDSGWFNFGDDDAIEWTYDSPTHVLTFSGNGSVDARHDDEFDFDGLWDSYAFLAEKVVYEEGITHIGSTYYVGDYVRGTGDYFSRHREALSKAKEVVLPKSLTEIGMNAFSDFVSLEKITIPSSVEVIGAGAFNGCNALKEIEILGDNTKLEEGVFSNCPSVEIIKISSNKVEIPNGTFGKCTKLKKIIAPNGLGKLYKDSFYILSLDEKSKQLLYTELWSPNGELESVHRGDVESKLLLGYTKEYVQKMEVESFDSKLKKGIECYDKGLYYEAQNEFQRFKETNWINMKPVQQQTLQKHIDKAKAGIDYESISEKGINYYNQELYYEAIKTIQDFCNTNWNNMSKEHQEDALHQLKESKTKLAEHLFSNGKNYYNQGLYYEAIEEIQDGCDVNWHNMTAEQQQNALYYLNNAKSKLADYQFVTGKNYYNKGLYYEAKPYFESAVDYYEQINYGTQWQSANDYLYNTNEKITAWENRPLYWSSYETCNRCYGSGRSSCYSCDGDGYEIEYYYKSRDTYKGNDKFDYYDSSPTPFDFLPSTRKKVCSLCDGSGIWYCSNCDGKGKVEVKHYY